VEEKEVLSHSLKAEHRLLTAIEDELKLLHMKTEQLRRNGFGKNAFLNSW
jgi:hypothetical protein